MCKSFASFWAYHSFRNRTPSSVLYYCYLNESIFNALRILLHEHEQLPKRDSTVKRRYVTSFSIHAWDFMYGRIYSFRVLLNQSKSLNCWQDKRNLCFQNAAHKIKRSFLFRHSRLELNWQVIGIYVIHTCFWCVYRTIDFCLYYHKLKEQPDCEQWAMRYAEQPHNNITYKTNSVHAYWNKLRGKWKNCFPFSTVYSLAIRSQSNLEAKNCNEKEQT